MVVGRRKEGGRGRWKMGNKSKGKKAKERIISSFRDIAHLPAAPVCLGSRLLPESCLYLLPSSSTAP